MGLNFKRGLRVIMMFAIATSVAIGCGDGKRRRRQPVKKAPGQAQKPNSDINPKTGKPFTPEEKKQLEAEQKARANETPQQKAAREKAEQEALKKKNGRLDEVQKKMEALVTEGNPIGKNELPDGEYRLTNIASSLLYSNKTNFVRAIRNSTVKVLNDGRYQISNENDSDVAATGGMTDYPDIGRTLYVHFRFKVAKQGGVFVPDNSSVVENPVPYGFKVKDLGNGKFEVVHQQLDKVQPEINLLEMLAAEGNANSNELKKTDSKGRKLIVKLRKVSATKVNVAISIDERTGSTGVDGLTRDIVLSYEIDASAVQQPAAPPTNETRTDTQPPAPEKQTGEPPAGPPTDEPPAP